MSGITQALLAGSGVNKFNGFSTPAQMNGSTSAQIMNRISVNSSGLFSSIGNQQGGSYYPLYAYSSNGTTWTTPAVISSSANSFLLDLAVSPVSNRFVAVGYNYPNPIFAYSNDGISWNSITSMGSNCLMFSIYAKSDGSFLALGSLITSGYGAYATSTDGTSWSSPAAMSASTTQFYPTGIAQNSSGLFVTVGRSAGDNRAYTAYSSNGTSWSAPALFNGYATTANMTSVVYNRITNKFVAVGYDWTNYYPLFSTSSDGINWSTPSLISGSTAASLTSVKINSNGVYVAVGSNSSAGSGTNSLYTYSNDGTTWAAPQTFSSSGNALIALGMTVDNTGRFISVGNSPSSNYYPMTAYSI